ncbi:unnamed protein product [Fructobacillus tropaeoli]|uniref:hypothetical protein n=1 Tax=Fructobacillus tropaeoli TaxID=709323 RepID=UPI002DA4533D|nr:unnamed protein product [Fructobacillus tropaeoli]
MNNSDYRIKYNFFGKRVKVVSLDNDVAYGVLTTVNGPGDTESGENEYEIVGDSGQIYSADESEIKSMTVID